MKGLRPGTGWRRRVLALLPVLCACVCAADARAQQPSWEEIGPFHVGGRVSALAVDPSNPQRLVAGTPAGGLWVSHDGGATWSGLALWLASVPISTIAFDPANPAKLFVGTGTLADNGGVTAGIGLLASADGGATWSLRDLNAPGAFVSSVLVWPGDSQRVVVATDLGIRLSIDGGATFMPVVDGHAISTLRADPFDSNVAYAPSRSGLLKTTDRGETWTPLAAWPLLESDEFGAGVVALATSAQTPGLLYASVQVLGTFNSTARVLLLRSVNGGETFVSLPEPAGLCPGPQTCGFAHALAIDPANDQRLLAGGEELFRSVDGGNTWSAVAGAARGVHQIVRTSAAVYTAGRFGVAHLDPAWSSAVMRNNGLAITAVHSLDLAASPLPQVLASTGDSGTLLGEGDNPAWQVIFAPGEPVGPARFDPFDSATIMASRRAGQIFKSIDGGVTFAPADSGLDFAQPAADLAPLAASPHQPGTWYTGRLQMFSSVDHGDNWLTMRPVGFPEVGLIAVSPVVADRVYFATRQGGELYKADADTTEQLVVSTEPSLRLSSLYLDPLAQNQLYAAGTNTATQLGRVFKSADFGVTWTNITPPNLPPATSIVKDGYGALYVGTRGGVWRSANDGFTWTPYTNGLFAGGVNALQFGGGWLYAGTTGRGVFRIRELPLVSVESSPPGVTFLIDGQQVSGPFLAYWPEGSTHSITPLLRNDADVREEFLGWIDDPAPTRTVTASDANTWLLAGIKRSFRLTATPTPMAGGTITFSPESGDGFYPERSFVTVIPVPADDHRIVGFSGQISGNDGLVAFASMDQPRTVQAHFEPLRMRIETEPAGLPIEVDGVTVPTPITYQWSAGSTHTVSAPEYAGAAADDPILAFDGWSDLRARTHDVLVTRDTFVTDLKARYISTRRGVTVPAGGAATVTTTRDGDAPRMAALALSVESGASMPRSLQFVRGMVNNEVTTEIALASSSARTWADVVIEQQVDGAAGRTRLALFNPGTNEATVGILLRDAAGAVQAAQLQGVVVPPGAHVTAWLDELMLLPPNFTSLLTLISTEPVVTSVQSWRGNFRPTHVYDPILMVPFVAGDAGVPIDPRVQVALVTPDTRHRLVIVNTGFSALAGTLRFFDTDGDPVAVTVSGHALSEMDYQLVPGAFNTVEFEPPASAALTHVRVTVTPAAGQPAPVLQMLQERQVGTVNGSATILPRVLPPSTPGRSFGAPVDRTLRETGLILSNTSPFPVTATVRFRDRAGLQHVESTRVVQPFAEHHIRTDAFAGLASGFQGHVSVTSDIPIHGVGYVRSTNGRGEEILAGFPVIVEANAPTRYPLAIDGDSWRSEWWFMNGGSPDTHLQLDFRGRNGASVHFPMQ